MAGIFDRMNHQGTGEGEQTLAPAFLDGILLMKIAGVRTNQQLLDYINEALAPGPNLDADAQDDLLDIVNHIEAVGTEHGRIARLHRVLSVAGLWETGLGGITEAEARTMTGVPFN